MDYTISNFNLCKIKIVLDILNIYDPVGMGNLVGENEYEIEAMEIANRSFILCIDELSQYIQDVFKFWYGGEIIDDSICFNIAKDIKAKISL